MSSESPVLDTLADMIDTHLADWPYDYPFCAPDGGWLKIPTVDDRFTRAGPAGSSPRGRRSSRTSNENRGDCSLR